MVSQHFGHDRHVMGQFTVCLKMTVSVCLEMAFMVSLIFGND